MGKGGRGRMRIKDMCETISKAKILKDKSGNNPTPEEVFNYSPTGELFKLWEWYDVAKVVLHKEG